MVASPPVAASRILNKLDTRSIRRNGDGWKARCPAHDDKVASLSVHETDGKVLLKCFAGCSADQVMQAVGLTMADLFADSPGSTAFEPLPFRPRAGAPGERLAAIYQYGNGAGTVLAEKGRFELPGGQKTFRWRPTGAEKWSGLGGLQLADLALWGAELIDAAPPQQWVYYCEGEKAAQTCRDHGLLAVTHAGGASTRDFGASLEVLRGRKVALWPDNDGAGREYMATVHARIRGLAAEVRVIAVPLPPKGDAVEYFGGGGTLAGLEDGALTITGPSVEYLATDRILITTPVGMGTVSFDFDEIEKTTRSLDTELTITLNAPGVDRTPYSERINLLSASARDDLRKDLEAVYGKEPGWTKLLNTIFGLSRQRFVAMDRSIDIYDVEPLRERELFFHNPLIPRDSVTILFGDRGSVKSYITSTIAFCTAFGEPLWGQRIPQGPVLYIDYEDNKENFRRRIDRIATGLDLPVLPNMIRYENLMGIPFADAARAIRKKVIAEGIILVIVDSAGPAVSGKPEDAVSAIPLMQALRRLGVTVILLAHVPKNRQEQPKDPFGSIFYSNLARRTWYVEKVQEEASDIVDVGLYCKKVNDGPLPHPIAVQVHFEGLNGPISIRQTDMAAAPALQEQRDMRYRVWDALELAGHPMTIAQIAADIHADLKAVEHALTRNPRRFVLVGELKGDKGRPSKLWGMAARDA